MAMAEIRCRTNSGRSSCVRNYGGHQRDRLHTELAGNVRPSVVADSSGRTNRYRKECHDNELFARTAKGEVHLERCQFFGSNYRSTGTRIDNDEIGSSAKGSVWTAGRKSGMCVCVLYMETRYICRSEPASKITSVSIDSVRYLSMTLQCRLVMSTVHSHR